MQECDLRLNIIMKALKYLFLEYYRLSKTFVGSFNKMHGLQFL